MIFQKYHDSEILRGNIPYIGGIGTQCGETPKGKNRVFRKIFRKIKKIPRFECNIKKNIPNIWRVRVKYGEILPGKKSNNSNST